ncbi:MAG: ABC transporter substrate-binding protein [Salaquimonas sp.]
MPKRYFKSPTTRKIITGLAFACTLLATSISAQAQQKIGLSLPLSGTASRLAQQFLIGANLALKVHNQNSSSQLEMVTADDACDAEIAKLAAKEMIAAKVGIVTGLLCNEAAKTIATQLVDSQIPLLVAGARSERLIKDRERERWNLWQLSPGDNDASSYAAETLSKSWTGEPYAIVDDGTVYGRNTADAFRAVMEENGLPPQFTDTYRPTQSTQARLVRRLRRAGITHVFIGGAAEDLALIASNSKELDIPLQIAGGETLSIVPFLKDEFQPPDGLLAITEKIAINPQLSPELIALFETENIEPETHVLTGYQAIEVAAQALGNNSQMTGQALAGIQFETILGPVSFDVSGKNSAEQYELYVWKNKQFERVAQ